MLSDIIIKSAFMSKTHIGYYIASYKSRIDNLMSLECFCAMDSFENAKERVDEIVFKSANLALLNDSLQNAEKSLTSVETEVLNCKILGKTKRMDLLSDNSISVANYRAICRRAFKKLNIELSKNWGKDELFIQAFNSEALIIKSYRKCRELETIQLRPLKVGGVIRNVEKKAACD